MDPARNIPEDELVRRVLYALLRPVVKLAAAFDVPLKELSGLLEVACFHELRNQGMTLRETGDALGISQRKAVRLAKQLRETFVVPELRHNLPRRIEFMLWAQPMSAARLKQVLQDVDEAQVDEALGELLGEGRIEPVENRVVEFAPVSSLRKLPRDTRMRQLGALNSFVDNVADATFGRFFQGDPRAFARTLTFKVPSQGAARLERWYDEAVLPEVMALDEAAEADEAREAFQLSLCWAPYEYLKTSGEGDK